jgi:hypothetical protein
MADTAPCLSSGIWSAYSMRRSYRKPEFRLRTRGYSVRRVGIREPIERFLIVCEGEKTEPSYFRSFRVPKDIITVIGLGANTVSLVKQGIERAQEDEYDQVWCVFDRDSFPAEMFNEALALAERHGIRVAYSNEAFELWYLLHFSYHDAAISRLEYRRKLTLFLGRPYAKNCENMYEELEEKQESAIRNAARLYSQYSPCRPECDNPSTTVHLLVQELNRFVNEEKCLLGLPQIQPEVKGMKGESRTSPVSAHNQLKRVVQGLHERLSDNLTGIYLHGSLAMGCFNPERHRSARRLRAWDGLGDEAACGGAASALLGGAAADRDQLPAPAGSGAVAPSDAL